MDLVSKHYMIQGAQALSPITTPSSSIFGSHSSGTSFPIIAIAIIGILATAFLLVSYYIFVIKCCLNWHRMDLLRRFSLSQRGGPEDPLMAYPPALEVRGLDESVIRSLPIFQFSKGLNSKEFGERNSCECAVCLNEFQEDEKLRMIPNCSHVFHIDCIDVWLQNNANCPLCRTSISSTTRFPIDQIIAPSSTPQDPNPYTGNVVSNDEDYVVIELGTHHSVEQTLLATQERLNSGDLSGRSISPPPPPRKLEQRIVHKMARKFHKVTSMGDECIDIRDKDERFAVEPIRRSFSMDSSADPKFYSAIQEAFQQNRQVSEVSPIEGCSNRVRRSFFTFGHGRGSKRAVLPVYLEP
ncbi:RING-H2 finger protein ATL16-like [Mangifera indica]|uniref:RING-H2 finger protein ATL16-like n=1 Tax=Mangifera indica TaxID=29780 RepID=UPI001CFB593D|nr:RING-H2 finger protein ATL16-like [Mangifera indica]